MRLRQLEIKGFKSFANQTIVNFAEDVIGIVGPNGSGKSNIVDAIRWVLGEQKGRELRLDKMSSVIFNGTKKKKAGNVASVSLTFDNDKGILPTEYGSVEITRMLYRSGDSEYRLNGVQCRLKDITSLLLDTGIGSNSYAIIALGMVDDILADKDNSRRRMFEQAAGISKYKQRKRETLNKLKNTEGDLDRIEDLLHEIQNNLRSLEKQAKRARRYLELKAQYKERSMIFASAQVQGFREKYEGLRGKIASAEDGYRDLDVRVRTLEASLETEKKQHVDQERALGDRQKQLNALVGELRGLDNEKKMLGQRKTFVASQLAKLRRELEEADAQTQTLTGQIDSTEAKVREETATEAAYQEALATAKAALEEIREGHRSIKGRLEEGLKQQQTAERKIFDIEKRKAINANQIANYRSQIERNAADMDDRRGEKESLEAALAELEAEEKKQLEEVERLRTAEAERRERLEATRERTDRLQAEQAKINRHLDRFRNEFKLTKNMIENLEGFPESIKFLAKNKEWKSDAPLLTDLLLVDEDYRAAVENYLGPYLNYYVVKTELEARAAIALLGKHQKGKANFICLDAIAAPKGISPDAPVNCRRMVDVITVDEAYSSVLELLVGHALIIEDDTPPQSSDPVAGEFFVVTKSGDYQRKYATVTGGSVGLFEGKRIGRKKNLEVLDDKIRQAETDRKEVDRSLGNERTQLQQLREQRTDREVAERERALSKVQQRRAALKARVESFTGLFTDTEAKNTRLAEQVAETETATIALESELTTTQSEVAALRKQLAGTDSGYQQLSAQLSEASAEYNQRNIEYIRQQNTVQALNRELQFSRNRLKELQQQEANNREQLNRLGKESRQFDEQETTLARNLERMSADRTKYQQTLNTVEQAYFAARTKINELEDDLRRAGRKRQDEQVRTNQLKEQFTAVRFKIDGIAERLKIEFTTTLEELDALDLPEWAGSEADLELKVDRLRSRIAGYGEINPLAVEAYDEMKERHERITQQRDDIVEAKTTLLKTIKEIEETATMHFLESFAKVREHFIEVFRSLFTEDDNCDLILENPEAPLESKIEIIAKPKGKRPTTINQLSGGEKTLTATALLFALYLLKPAPFCIFDEVDAPLDDANIAKFNRIIKKFSSKSQFVIVTHNKLTMEAVDTIYGVYTNEQQGSGVLPVKFTELEGSAVFSAA